MVFFKNYFTKKEKYPVIKTAKMADGKGCNTCNSEHDGNFYRFCKCSCHDRIAREIVG